MRRLVLAIAVAALTAAAACSGDRAPTPSTTTVDGDVGADDVVPRFADGLREGSNGIVDEVEAQCIAELVVEELGTETVIALAFDESETAIGVPPELEQAMVKGYAQCLPPEDLIAIGNDR